MGHHKERLATRPEIEHPSIYTDGDLFEFLLSVLHVAFSRIFGRYLKMLEQHIVAVSETVIDKTKSILVFFNLRADDSLVLNLISDNNRQPFSPSFKNEISFLFALPLNIYNTICFLITSSVFNLTNIFSYTSLFYFNWVNVLGLSTIYNLNVADIIATFASKLTTSRVQSVENSNSEVNPFQSRNIGGSNLTDISKFSNSELSTDFRYQRVLNPVFAYDYKVGNYATQHTTDNYKHLFITFSELTGGVRKPS